MLVHLRRGRLRGLLLGVGLCFFRGVEWGDGLRRGMGLGCLVGRLRGLLGGWFGKFGKTFCCCGCERFLFCFVNR